MAQTLYEVLGVPPTANAEAVRTAYVGLIKRHHGENAAPLLQEITSAYDALKDPQRRAAYDASLAHPAQEPSTRPSATVTPASRSAGPEFAETRGIVDAPVRQLTGIAIGAVAGHLCSMVLYVLIFPPVLWVLGAIVAYYYGAFAFLVSLGVGIGTGFVAWTAGLIAGERYFYGADYTFGTRQAVLVRASVVGMMLNPDILLYAFLALCAVRLIFLGGQLDSFSAQLGTAGGALLAHKYLMLRW
jgi:curved DNA-binding protein CbpA